MKHSLRRVLAIQFTLMLSLAGGAVIFADTVAEWKFDSPVSTDGIVKLDEARKGASNQSRLSETAKISDDKTDIGEKWAPFLSSGFLEARAGGNVPQNGIPDDQKNKYGLFTIPSGESSKNSFYSSYFGFSGYGQGKDGSHLKGGTVYLILSPLDDFKKNSHYGFMGTGHVNEGRILLGINTAGALELTLGDTEAIFVTIERKFKPRKWYFIAASWRESSKPVLYVREMDPNGPEMSPKADAKLGDIELNPLKGPSTDPLAIGASYYNPGRQASTVYGAGARLAYARFDNTFSDEKEIESVFLGLGVP